MGPYAEIPSRRKVTTVALLASLCSVGLVLLALVAYRATESEQKSIRVANIEAEAIAQRVVVPLQSNDVASAQNVFSDLGRSQVDAACVYTRDGKIFCKFVRSGAADYEFPLPELDLLRLQNGSLELFRGIDKGGEVLGTLYLHIDTGSRLAGLPHRNAIVASVAGVLLVFAIGFGVWLRRLLKLHAEDTTGVFPLVPEGMEVSAPPDVSRDELRLLSKRVDTIETKVQRIEKELGDTKPAKPRPAIEPKQPKQPVTVDRTRLSTLDLNAATQRVLQVMHDKIESRKAEVIVQTNLPFVLADNAVVEQVLRSLIENALRFCPQNVRPRIRVGGCVNGDAVRLWVHDNGVGIAPEEQKLVFTSNREDEASLALVKQRVEKMRGQVGFDSAAGQGSTFWIELPKSQAATLN